MKVIKHFSILFAIITLSIISAITCSAKVVTEYNFGSTKVTTNMSHPSANGFWQNSNNQGIRISVYDYTTKKKIGKSFDVAYGLPSGSIQHSTYSNGDLGCKVDYINGTKKFELKNGYDKITNEGLPKVFDNGSDFEALKAWLGSHTPLIAQNNGSLYYVNPGDNPTSVNDSKCINYKNYVIVFEPVLYFYYGYDGRVFDTYALTLHELWLFNGTTNDMIATLKNAGNYPTNAQIIAKMNSNISAFNVTINSPGVPSSAVNEAKQNKTIAQSIINNVNALGSTQLCPAPNPLAVCFKTLMTKSMPASMYLESTTTKTNGLNLKAISSTFLNTLKSGR